MICLYCGLQSAVTPNHAKVSECVDALQREVSRLQDHLRLRHQRRDPLVSRHGPVPDRNIAGVTSASRMPVR